MAQCCARERAGSRARQAGLAARFHQEPILGIAYRRAVPFASHSKQTEESEPAQGELGQVGGAGLEPAVTAYIAVILNGAKRSEESQTKRDSSPSAQNGSAVAPVGGSTATVSLGEIICGYFRQRALAGLRSGRSAAAAFAARDRGCPGWSLTQAQLGRASRRLPLPGYGRTLPDPLISTWPLRV